MISSLKKYSSIIVAVVIALAALIWIGSGQMATEENLGEDKVSQNTQAGPSEQVSEQALDSVRYEVRYITSEVQEFRNLLRLTGSTLPYRTVTIRAETGGSIEEMNARMGQMLEENALIARLDEGNRQSQLKRAKAVLNTSEIEHNASLSLASKGFQTKTNQAATAAALASAEADLAQIELDIERTQINAPYKAIVQQNFVEVGDYVSVGDPIAELIDLDPLLISFEVSEQERPLLQAGIDVKASLMNGQIYQGVLTNIASLSDAQTRTFAIEVEIDNADFAIPAGLTAKVEIPTQSRQAHVISPAWLTLADDGTVGVKWLDGDRVKFTQVEILADREREMWISGLPSVANIITVGQEYVKDGAIVTAIEDDAHRQ